MPFHIKYRDGSIGHTPGYNQFDNAEDAHAAAERLGASAAASASVVEVTDVPAPEKREYFYVRDASGWPMTLSEARAYADRNSHLGWRVVKLVPVDD